MNSRFFRKPKPVSPGPCSYGVRSRGTVRGGFGMEPIRIPKLSSREISILSWSTLLFSVFSGVSLIGVYFSKFMEVSGSGMMLVVGLVSFVFVHTIVAVSEFVNESSLRFYGLSFGMLWGSVGLIVLLDLISRL